jgi:hypothetical protein
MKEIIFLLMIVNAKKHLIKYTVYSRISFTKLLFVKLKCFN